MVLLGTVPISRLDDIRLDATKVHYSSSKAPIKVHNRIDFRDFQDGKTDFGM